MPSQAEALYHLQTIDLQIVQFQQRIAALDAALKDSGAIVPAQQAVAQAQAVLGPLRVRAKTLDQEIQTNKTKADTTEQTLYGGTIRNTKEMKDMQQEIAALNRRRADLEDELLTTMMELESAEAVLKDAEVRLSEAEAQHHSQRGQIELERGREQVQLEKAQRDRADAAKAVTPENLKRYMTMRPRKNNRPIARMQNNTCEICGVEQESAVSQVVRRNQDLVLCSNCERILVYF